MFKRKKEEDRDDDGATFQLPSLSHNEAKILLMLSKSAAEMFGLEMIEAAGGALKRGTIYVTLHRMEEKGFIDSRLEARPAPEVGIPRRKYRITGHGARVLAAYEAARMVMSADMLPAR
jgi:DNA-binding PadR family transcriptional regulator